VTDLRMHIQRYVLVSTPIRCGDIVGRPSCHQGVLSWLVCHLLVHQADERKCSGTRFHPSRCVPDAQSESNHRTSS